MGYPNARFIQNMQCMVKVTEVYFKPLTAAVGVIFRGEFSDLSGYSGSQKKLLSLYRVGQRPYGQYSFIHCFHLHKIKIRLPYFMQTDMKMSHYKCNSMGGNAVFCARKSKTFFGGCLDVYLRDVYAAYLCDVFCHLRNIGAKPWLLGKYCSIYV